MAKSVPVSFTDDDGVLIEAALKSTPAQIRRKAVEDAMLAFYERFTDTDPVAVPVLREWWTQQLKARIAEVEEVKAAPKDEYPAELVDALVAHRQLGSSPGCACGWRAPVWMNDTNSDRIQWAEHMADVVRALL